MKQTQFEKDNEAYTTNDKFIVLDGFFPRLSFLKEYNKIIRFKNKSKIISPNSKYKLRGCSFDEWVIFE